MIDLQQFCPKHARAEWMERPFSRADYTWATDGKLAVRVPLRDNVPGHPAAPHIERVWPARWPEVWRQPLRRELPTVEYEECWECEGRGHKHECPTCQCVCRECNGTGEVLSKKAVQVGECAIQLHYARLIVGLDWIELSPPVAADRLLCFRFEGGEGVLMMLRAGHELEVVASI